jgi:hypothetical protein
MVTQRRRARRRLVSALVEESGSAASSGVGGLGCRLVLIAVVRFGA